MHDIALHGATHVVDTAACKPIFFISCCLRHLDSLYQRVDVIKMYGLSRIYYLASVLPIPKTFVSKINQQIGKFIWSLSGKVLRVSFDEMKLSLFMGGMSLTCIKSMADSLILTQVLRLVKSGDLKSCLHIEYWLNDVVADLLPKISCSSHALQSPGLYQTLADVISEAKMAETLNAQCPR